MTISFVIPYVPIPRIIKRINTAKEIDDVNLIYWDRGTEDAKSTFEDPEVDVTNISLNANEGKPIKRIYQSLIFIIKVVRHLISVKPEIIHVTKTDMLLAVYLYSIITKKKTKIVYEVSDIHKFALNDSGTYFQNIIKKILFYVEKKTFVRVNKLIVTSPYFYDYYYKRLISRERVLYLPNTPERIVFEDYNKTVNSTFTVAYIGKVRYVEQIKNLIDVSTAANINVLIAGNGIGLDEIISYSKKMSNVYIHGAYNYEDEIAYLYSQADAIYSVYDIEITNVKIALPNRLYEAAYCGLPLIVSKSTYLEKIVNENNLGISVDPYSKEDLLKKIRSLKYADMNKYKMSGKNFYEKFNSKNNYIKLSKMYNELKR